MASHEFLPVFPYGKLFLIRYGTYKLVQKMPGGEKLTGFTRILHRVKPDECMDEVCVGLIRVG